MKLLEDMELHTDAYRMYYVGMSDQRHEAQKQFKQIHVLFIREDHKDVEFCDKHFGSHLRKNNGFAPFRFQGGEWRVFTKARVSDRLMVNLAVAGSASLVNPPTRVYRLESAREGRDTPELEHRLLAPRLAAGNATAPAVEHRHLEADKLLIQQVLSAVRDHEKATGKVPARKGAGSVPTAPQEEEKKGWLKKWVLKSGGGAYGALQPDELKVNRQDFEGGPTPDASPEPVRVVYSTRKDSSGSEVVAKVWMTSSLSAEEQKKKKEGLLKAWDGEVGGLQPSDLTVQSQAFGDEQKPDVFKSSRSSEWKRVSYTTKRTKDGSEMVTSIRMMPQGDPTTA